MLSVYRVEIPFWQRKLRTNCQPVLFRMSLIYQWFQIDIVLKWKKKMLSYPFLINDFNQMQCIKKFKSKYNSTTRKEYRRNQESDSTRFGDKSPSSCTYPCAMLARSLPDRCHGKKGTATSFTWQVSLLSFQIVHPGFFALLPHLRLLRKTRPKWVTSNKIQTI